MATQLLQLLKLVRKSSHFFEPVAQSAGGAASATGWNEGKANVPTQSAATLGDSNSGMHLTIGILAALLQREHTGEGTFCLPVNARRCIEPLPYQVA